MKKSLIKKTVLLAGVAAAVSITSALAVTVPVQVTAATTVSNLPANFNVLQFTLLRPWEMDVAPSFAISSSPTSDTLLVNVQNTMPALEISDTNIPPNIGLSWFYYCNGLSFTYSQTSPNIATVTFSGMINASQPGTGVTCQCKGSTCSTTSTLPATRKVVMQ